MKSSYTIKVSGLEVGILTKACEPWNLGFGWGAGDGYGNLYVWASDKQLEAVIRALKLHQVEYEPRSKNRKRVKNVITQIEYARNHLNDK